MPLNSEKLPWDGKSLFLEDTLPSAIDDIERILNQNKNNTTLNKTELNRIKGWHRLVKIFEDKYSADDDLRKSFGLKRFYQIYDKFKEKYEH